MTREEIDVLIIGGGPAGSTTAGLLKKHNPDLRVTLVESATFPRYHIGESLVLEVNKVLEELGVIDQMDEAGFIRKAGATYVWGEDRYPWSFFFAETTGRRPHFAEERDYTWHVDRAQFDDMLLTRARELGVEVRQPARFVEPIMEGERVVGGVIEDETGRHEIHARFTVDASGRAGALAKHFGKREFDGQLEHVATFGYFRGAQLEREYSLGWDLSGITIVSLPIGWMWYIPVDEGTVSVGVVTDATTFKERAKMGLEEHLLDALQSAPEPKRWLADAELYDYPGAPRRVMVESDFNYHHDRLYGPGWALVGDAGAFLDPLFSFGVFLATTGGRLLAYSLGTMLDGRYAGASEALLGQAYESQMRGYFDAFRTMVCVFYGFNSSKEFYWSRSREILHGQALPEGLSDRDAFFAFTCGYGVNTGLAHEAIQHFGNVSLNRIRDMCIGEGDPELHINDTGAYGEGSLPSDARPKLNASFERSTALIPVPDSGRVVPVTRVQFPGGHGFPRYLLLPDALVDMLEELDGTRSVAELHASIAEAKVGSGWGAKKSSSLIEPMLRALSNMQLLEVG